MPSFEEAAVAEVLSERPGITRVRLETGERAYALTEVTGPVGLGDRVVVNTTAVRLGLGTGGWHVVHWNLTRGPWTKEGPGHLMKARYTSIQTDVGAAEEDEPDMATSLASMPVVVCGLHSQLPVVAAAVIEAEPNARVAYVMTDGGALPLALSDMVERLRQRDLLVGTVTTGHAFGGDLESLNVPSGLAAARHLLGADIAVVAMGPGVAGTGTRLGFTALEVAPALDAAAWLGGQPVACVRASSGDGRGRHQGISHHTRTALDATRSEVDVAVPPDLEVSSQMRARHRWEVVDPGPVGEMLTRFDLRVTTMGRGPDEDPLFFDAAASAGRRAASLLGSFRRPGTHP